MATTTKKGSKNKKAKLRRPLVKASLAKQAQTIAELRQQLAESLQRESATAKESQDRNRQLTEALEQQTATSEILRVIASSPTDLQPVLNVVAESAARLCEADDASIFRIDGNVFQRWARYGSIPIQVAVPAVSRDTVIGRAVVDRQTLHVHDLAAELETEFPGTKTRQQISGSRTVLATPLLREGVPIGVIFIRRTEVRPFSDKQIALLKTFADQAVIAIENVRLFQELTEALEQQTATSEILGVIASSPTDIQPVLDTIAENAARVCGSYDAVIRLVEGNILRLAAHYGPVEPGFGVEQPLTRSSASGRAVLDRELIHIEDFMAVVATEFPEAMTARERMGGRTVLAAPLLREGVAIGVILIRRTEVRPFTDKQIKLLETFAAQAVIAIENVRLFKEIQERNAELREALEHQTATAEVLGIISRSPTDVQPVLDAIVESAARVCGIDDVVLRLIEGDMEVVRAHFGSVPIRAGREAISVEELHHRWIAEHGTLHVPDVRERRADFPTLALGGHSRTFLIVPLRQHGELVGTLNARRTEVRPFTPAQIKLLETFADQAVIALENVRLFQELTEALEQQTATSEILGVIASSPTDIQPVLDVVAENAARVCGANDAVIRLVEGNMLRSVAHHGSLPQSRPAESEPLDGGWIPARAVLERQTIHIHDIAAVENEFPESTARAKRAGVRTMLTTPLLREGIAIGVIHIRRTEVRPFTDKQIALLKTFADQAVIAIENVRLFQELKESLEQQTATSEILGVIASSPTDIQPVLDTIAQSAARVCGSDDATIRLVEGDEMILAAHFGTIPPPGPGRGSLGWRSVGNEALLQRRTIHIPDLQAEAERFPDSSHIGRGIRTFLVTPLLREGTAIGVIAIRRTEVKPFTDKQVALLETFASQAVIAIENVRLFKELQERNAELREALEHQTATAEVLSIISRSPTDVQPVLDAIVESAARVCGIDDVVLRLREENVMVMRAHFGPIAHTNEPRRDQY